ncbi:MAG: choice-of-anchor Q domain-containing protein [Planctomycetota bacterium]
MKVGTGGTLDWGSGMIDADPLFVDPLNNDFHLTSLSPCINRGTNEGAASHDIDGDPRLYMGTVDMGSDEYTGIHPLEADAFSISEDAGGTVNFSLTCGLYNGGRTYLVVGSLSGTAPGTPLPGGHEMLRLNWDLFTDIVLGSLNTPVFMDFYGKLDYAGHASAQLNAPPVPGLGGTTMHYAYCLSHPFDFVSNPVAVEIVQQR